MCVKSSLNLKNADISLGCYEHETFALFISVQDLSVNKYQFNIKKSKFLQAGATITEVFVNIPANLLLA